jgi:tetratricopeptide (TPR) repeat protein
LSGPAYHAAYAGCRRGLEAALASGGAGALTSSAEAALAHLEQAPAEPVLLALAGAALRRLGAAEGGAALAAAAERLDGPLAAQALAGVPDAAEVTGDAGALDARARAVAERAAPGPVEPVSLCMIVRDEEEQLERCLRSLAGAVDELIVVDTGSTDGTVAIAEAHGARVLRHAWGDHFAEARNVGVEAATGAWIVYVDADEALDPADREALRELTRRTWREGFTFLRRNHLTEEAAERPASTNRTLRMFRNRPEYRFEGRVHEGVSARMPAGSPERVEAAQVRIDHYGFTPQLRARRDKSRRNLALLERQAREEPPSAFLEFNLGSEYAALGDHARAVEHFAAAHRLLAGDAPPFAESLLQRYVAALRMLGRLDLAAEVARDGLELLPGFVDLMLEAAHVERARGDLDAAERLARRCLELGDATGAAAGIAGAGSFHATTLLAGLALERGEPAEAERLLLAALADHPHHLDAALLLVEAMLARGATPAEIDAAVAGAAAMTPQLRFALARALREAGHVEAAAAQLAVVRDAWPGTGAASLAGAEAALDAGEWAEAARGAAAVDDASGLAAEAAIVAFTAQVALRDLAAAERAAGLARTAGAPEELLGLLAGWLARARGQASERPVPAAALPTLTAAFERFLAASDVDRAVELLPLFEDVDGLDPRMRRELLAAIYLRRGLVDLAADEWAAACEEHGPDSRALLGLARVAAERGSVEDALTFAEAAVELDPGSDAARQAVATLSSARRTDG